MTEPVYGGHLARDYLQKKVNPVLVQGLTELCKQKPEDAIVRICIHVHVKLSTSLNDGKLYIALLKTLKKTQDPALEEQPKSFMKNS